VYASRGKVLSVGRVSVLSWTLSAAIGGLALAGGAAGNGSGVPSARGAYGADAARFTYEAAFTAKRPAKAAGFSQAIDYVNPEDPGAKPPAIVRVHVVLPKGSRIDPSVPGVCTATDLELIVDGRDACPPESRVGEGTLSADTGAPGESGMFPRTIETEVSFFNGERDLVFLAESTNTPAPLRIPAHFEVGERSFTSTVPPLPGAPPPDPFLAIDKVTNSLHYVAAEAGAGYITTPSRCGRKRRWRFTAEVTYRDGVVQKQTAAMRCRRKGPGRRG
jgi:hypothetical protein